MAVTTVTNRHRLFCLSVQISSPAVYGHPCFKKKPNKQKFSNPPATSFTTCQPNKDIINKLLLSSSIWVVFLTALLYKSMHSETFKKTILRQGPCFNSGHQMRDHYAFSYRYACFPWQQLLSEWSHSHLTQGRMVQIWFIITTQRAQDMTQLIKVFKKPKKKNKNNNKKKFSKK